MEITVYAELGHLVPLGVRLTAPHAPPSCDCPHDYAACMGTAAGTTGLGCCFRLIPLIWPGQSTFRSIVTYVHNQWC
jgi:hypothetical protein